MKTAIAAAFLAAASLGAQSPAEAAVDRAVKAYSSVRTAKATFEQTIRNPLTGSDIRSRGEFEQSRPDRFAFRFSDPKGDVILSDGKYVWLYLPSSTPGQVIRAPLTADIEGSIDLIGAFFDNPRSRYNLSDGGTATIEEHDTRVVNLVPRANGASFKSAKVWIDTDSGILRQFEAEELNGVVRRVLIKSYVPNAQVARSAFTFTPPKGVRIVDGETLR